MNTPDAAPPGLEGMRLRWSPIWRAEWAATPDAYVAAGLVAWEKSRRLLRGDDTSTGLRVYLGVRHTDPARWDGAGEPHTSFFASALLGGRTLFLHTYPTADAALAALSGARQRLAGRA
jgi:hypothetical protein